MIQGDRERNPKIITLSHASKIAIARDILRIKAQGRTRFALLYSNTSRGRPLLLVGT